MRTFQWNAPIVGAGALLLCVLIPALVPLKAEERGAHVVVPVYKTVTPQSDSGVKSALTELKTNLDRSDRAVALKALQMALTELGDGVTLVWRREASQLTGRIRPVSAFRDADGRICRAVHYSLTRGEQEQEIEGIACRSVDGRWAIAG